VEGDSGTGRCENDRGTGKGNKMSVLGEVKTIEALEKGIRWRYWEKSRQ
jgi:hypothetical protein